jgi:hypothetical protein
MTIPSITPALRDLSLVRADTAGTRPPIQRPQNEGTPTTAATPGTTTARLIAAAQNGATVQAPEGTDPKLWSILTSEERAFFARSTTSGPLTYSKIMMPNRTAAPTALAIRGGRVDVRA